MAVKSKICEGETRHASEREKYRLMRKEYKSKEKELQEKSNMERFAIRDSFKGLSNPAGRKKKYTPITLKNKIIDYFAMIRSLDKPPTVSGLMVHLKMHRDQFYQYYEYPEFRPIMEQTKLMIENWAEERITLSKYNPSGLIFVLKNRFGWKDLTSVEQVAQTPEDQLIARIAALAPGLLGYTGASETVLEAEVLAEEAASVDQIDFVKYKEARKKNLTYEEFLKREEQQASSGASKREEQSGNS